MARKASKEILYYSRTFCSC